MKPPNNSGSAGERGPPPTDDATIREAAVIWVARRDAGLSSQEQEKFETWLAADAKHRTAFAEYDSAWATLDRPAKGGVAHDVLDALQRLDRRQRRRNRLAGAVASVVLVCGISFWTLSRERTENPGDAARYSARMVLPAQKILADGSVVELREGAEVDADFEPERRRVVLRRGEAHFQVVKDPARPFVVEAHGVEIRAVGTAFAVQVSDRTIEVLVTEGRIAVEKPVAKTPAVADAAAADATVPTVGAGERAVVDAASVRTKVDAVAPAEMSERLGWRVAQLELSGAPLSEVIALLNRHAAARKGVRVSIADASLAPVRVSGLFRADNIATLLELLETGFGIVADRHGEEEIVLRKAPVSR